MTSHVLPSGTLARAASRFAHRSSWLHRPLVLTAAELAGLSILVALAAFLRTRVLGAPFWIDEGLSVGIAQHGAVEILGVLRQDGSPPLYYELLHAWIAVFGDSERSAHALSAAFAVLAVPAAHWATRASFGRRGALLAAALAAFSPFLSLYADEARMYSLLALEGTVAIGALLRVLRSGPQRRQLGVLAAACIALLYTHNWGAFLVASVAVVLLGVLAVRRRPSELRDAAVALAAVAVLFVPWLPSVAFQAQHTGAPWSHVPSPGSVGHGLRTLLGGSAPLTVLAVVAGGGALTLLGRRAPAQRRTATLAAVLVTAGALGLAFGYARLGSPAWAERYLAVLVGPLLVALAAGLDAAGAIGVLAVVVVCTCSWWGQPSVTTLGRKSDVHALAARVAPRLTPGAVVLSTQPEQVAELRYELGARDLSYRTPDGPVRDPRVVDWVDAMGRLQAASVRRDLRPLLARLHPGQQLLVVKPHMSHPDAPWTRRIRQIDRAWQPVIDADPRLRRILVAAPPRAGNSRSTVSMLLYVRR